MLSCEFCEIFKNNYFVEYPQTVASESVRYWVYFALSEVRLEEDQDCKNYLRITPEYLDELFVRIKDDIAKMRDANTPKIKIVVKIYHVRSFMVSFS